MKAEELRIGNWYQWDELASMGTPGPQQITHGQQIMDYIALKKGIPLTEEWLQRAGFDQRNGRTTWTLIVGEPGEFETSLQVGWVGKEYVQVCRSGINARSCPVASVHQLQNLYYALTGEELTISEPTKQSEE